MPNVRAISPSLQASNKRSIELDTLLHISSKYKNLNNISHGHIALALNSRIDLLNLLVNIFSSDALCNGL